MVFLMLRNISLFFRPGQICLGTSFRRYSPVLPDVSHPKPGRLFSHLVSHFMWEHAARCPLICDAIRPVHFFRLLLRKSAIPVT